MDPVAQDTHFAIVEQNEECPLPNENFKSSQTQLFKKSQNEENEVLQNRNTDSTRNSIGNLQMFKKQLRDTSPLERLQSSTKSVSDKQLTKKLDNMIDLLSRQLHKECRKSFDVDDQAAEKQEDIIKAVVVVQSFFRMLPIRRVYRQQRKWAEYRKHVIFELYDTEVRYVEDLKIIIKEVMNPLRQMRILDEEQSKRLFNNIEQICWLNEDFVKALEVKIQKFYHYQLIGDIAVKFVHFFKIYYDYFQNFSVDCVEQMRKDPSVSLKFEYKLKGLDLFIALREPPNGNLFRGLNLQSFLVKPVQRLPKYILLFKDLLKHTESDHPDYQNLTKTLEGFKGVMHKINDKINKQVQNLKMFELQKLFGDPNGVSILDATREFLAEETLTIVHQQKERSVIVYFMTDLVLISERVMRTEKLYKLVQLNENSFCKNLPDYKHFSDIFTLIGKHKTVTFLCGSKENKSKIMGLLQQLINDLKTRSDGRNTQTTEKVSQPKRFYPIQVHTVGTEEQETLMSKFTVYIVEVVIGLAKLKIFVRYREIVELEEMVRKEFPKMDLPHLSTLNFFNNHKTKVIETRKIQIENFLQTLLQTQQVSSDPDKWLQFLDLPPHFYSLGEIEQPQFEDLNPLDLIGQGDVRQKQSIRPESARKRLTLNLALEPLGRSTMTQSQRRQLSPSYNQRYFFMFVMDSSPSITTSTISAQVSPQTPVSPLQPGYAVVSASELFRCSRGGPITKLSRGSYQPGYTQSSHDWKFKLPEIIESVTINLMDDRSVTLEISDQSRCGDVIEMLAAELQLQAFLDFKLVLCDGQKRTIRVLDDDELLIKVVQGYTKPTRKAKETGILDFLQKIGDYFGTKDKGTVQLYLKKVLYLPMEQEQEDFKNDTVRLRLLCYQVFAEIKNEMYYLGFNEYCLYTALFLFIRYQDLQAKVQFLIPNLSYQLYSPRSFPHEKLREILPLRILRSVKENVWADNVFTFLKRIRGEIKGLQRQKIDNLKEQEEEKISENFLEQIDKIYLSQLLLIRQISLNTMYGVAKFSVQTVRSTQQEAKRKMDLSIPTNAVLGVSFIWLWIIHPSTQSPLQRFKIVDLFNLQYYTGHICFQIQEQDDVVFRFNTIQVFEIRRLLQEYQDVRTLQTECEQRENYDCGQKEL